DRLRRPAEDDAVEARPRCRRLCGAGGDERGRDDGGELRDVPEAHRHILPLSFHKERARARSVMDSRCTIGERGGGRRTEGLRARRKSRPRSLATFLSGGGSLMKLRLSLVS